MRSTLSSACRAVAVCGLLAGTALHGQTFRLLTFGDSITWGAYDTVYNPNFEMAGYPRRLRGLLNCQPGVCDIYNAGVPGEQTGTAVTRIDGVLDSQGPFDVMLLMEGTNDVFSGVSLATIEFNLAQIASKARNRGVETVHGSIIWFHPDGRWGTSKDPVVEALRDRVASLAWSNQRQFIDIWDELCPASHNDRHGHVHRVCFDEHYSENCDRVRDCGDNRGHPVGSGYDMMAARWYEGLTAYPPPAKPTLLSPVGEVAGPEVEFRWTKANRASWFRLLVEGSSGDVVDVWLETKAVCGSTACSYTVTDIDADEYSWQVRGRSPAGFGAWSDEAAISLQPGGLFQDGFESGSTSGWSATFQD